MMNRSADAKTLLAVRDMARSLEGLSAEQLNIFSRMMMLNDIRKYKKKNPNAQLPLKYTPQKFMADYKRFLAMAKEDEAVWEALNAELKLQHEINEQLAKLAEELNMPKLADKVRGQEFYILDYARLLKKKKINANYFEAVVDTRTQQLKDIERLETVRHFRNVYDRVKGGGRLKDALIQKFGKKWKMHIPQGYKIFNPLKGSFIHSAHSLAENLMGVELEMAGRDLGLSPETMKMLHSKVADNSDAHLIILPEALANTLDNLSKPVIRGPLGRIAKQLTTQWKKWMLFFPTRTIKYNLRNLTGDFDALIAGNPKAMRYIPQAIRELFEFYYGSGEASDELKEFQERGGAITIQSAQTIGEYKQLEEYTRLIKELKGKKASF